MNKTSIEWTDYSANPIRYREKATGRDVWHCEKVSAGCDHCYAESLARRFNRGGRFARQDRALYEPYVDHKELKSILNLRELQWPLPNVWLGFSAEDHPNFIARWREMQELAYDGWFVWCSYEPALGPINFHAAGGALTDKGFFPSWGKYLKWIVCGGESGPGARPFDTQWACDTIRQCQEAGVPCFMKQLGSNPIEHCGHPCEEYMAGFNETGKQTCPCTRTGGYLLNLRDKKGGDMAEWPEDLRVREFPKIGGEPPNDLHLL